LNRRNNNLNLLFARNWKDETPYKQKTPYSDLLKVEGKYRIAANTSLLFTWRDFGYESSKLKFDPLYRDVHDENIYDNRYEAPLDIYMGYKGYSVGFSHKEEAHNITLLFESYLDRTVITSRNDIPAKIKGIVVNGKTKLWDIEMNGVIEQRSRIEHYALGQLVGYNMHRLELNGIKNLKTVSGRPARLICRWQEESWPSIQDSNTMMNWILQEVKLESSFNSGPLRGLRWSTFILAEPYRTINKIRVGITTDYVMPNGLLLRIRLAYPNVEESSALRDQPNPFGQLLLPDNCLELVGGFSF
jgi:hypothetical protein